MKLLLAEWQAFDGEAAPIAFRCPNDHSLMFSEASNDYTCDTCGCDIAPRMWDCRFCNWCICLSFGKNRCGPSKQLTEEDKEVVMGKAMEAMEEMIVSEAMFFVLLQMMLRLLSILESAVC